MNTANQLYSQIKGLSESTTENHYQVVSLPDKLHKIGVSEEGFPKFFVVTSDNNMMQNLNAELLSVEYNMLCNIIEGNEILDNQYFTIITLRSENEQLQKMFIDVFLMMLESLPAKPSNISIASKIESLLSIFAKLKRQPIHKIQGLWAELLLIEQSLNPTILARAWHSSPSSKYDFTLGGDKIEVKSTQGENRVHHFSLDQLNPSANSRLLICSAIVRESAQGEKGLSVFDLYDRIQNKIAESEVRIHVSEVIAETLGSDYFVAEKKYFDYIEARDRLALYDYIDIPKIQKETIPQLVTEVRFSSDLTNLKDVREKYYNKDKSELFNALY